MDNKKKYKKGAICFNCGKILPHFEKKCRACHAVKFYSTRKIKERKTKKQYQSFVDMHLTEDDL